MPYYNIQYRDMCISSYGHNNRYGPYGVIIEECESNNTRQMFSAIPVYGDFGSLSVEKDITAPEAPDNFLLEVDESGGTKLAWDSVSDRNLTTDIELSLRNPTTGEFEIIDNDAYGYRGYAVDLSNMQEDEYRGYSVRAYDAAGNYSGTSSVSFKKPSAIPKPPKVEIMNVAEHGIKVTLKLPEYDETKVMGIQLYDGYQYLGTFTDEIVEVDAKSSRPRYTVRYKLQNSVSSVSSDLVIAIVNNYNYSD